MLTLSLAMTAFFMGLVGGPHCVVMCGAACMAIGSGSSNSKIMTLQPANRKATQNQAGNIALFQLGRCTGYGTLGALAALSVQGIAWLTTLSAALHPLWTLIHISALLLGLILLWQATQPAWLESLGRHVWHRVRTLTKGREHLTPFVLGMLWSLLPCGLLYSALMLAALTTHALAGASVMVLFALGTSIAMTVLPWLWLRLLPTSPNVASIWASYGVRLAGLSLTATASWALWASHAHNTAPWCIGQP